MILSYKHWDTAGLLFMVIAIGLFCGVAIAQDDETETFFESPADVLKSNPKSIADDVLYFLNKQFKAAGTATQKNRPDYTEEQVVSRIALPDSFAMTDQLNDYYGGAVASKHYNSWYAVERLARDILSIEKLKYSTLAEYWQSGRHPYVVWTTLEQRWGCEEGLVVDGNKISLHPESADGPIWSRTDAVLSHSANENAFEIKLPPADGWEKWESIDLTIDREGSLKLRGDGAKKLGIPSQLSTCSEDEYETLVAEKAEREKERQRNAAAARQLKQQKMASCEATLESELGQHQKGRIKVKFPGLSYDSPQATAEAIRKFEKDIESIPARRSVNGRLDDIYAPVGPNEGPVALISEMFQKSLLICGSDVFYVEPSWHYQKGTNIEDTDADIGAKIVWLKNPRVSVDPAEDSQGEYSARVGQCPRNLARPKAENTTASERLNTGVEAESEITLRAEDYFVSRYGIGTVTWCSGGECRTRVCPGPECGPQGQKQRYPFKHFTDYYENWQLVKIDGKWFMEAPLDKDRWEHLTGVGPECRQMAAIFGRELEADKGKEEPIVSKFRETSKRYGDVINEKVEKRIVSCPNKESAFIYQPSVDVVRNGTRYQRGQLIQMYRPIAKRLDNDGFLQEDALVTNGELKVSFGSLTFSRQDGEIEEVYGFHNPDGHGIAKGDKADQIKDDLRTPGNPITGTQAVLAPYFQSSWSEATRAITYDQGEIRSHQWTDQPSDSLDRYIVVKTQDEWVFASQVGFRKAGGKDVIVEDAPPSLSEINDWPESFQPATCENLTRKYPIPGT